MTEPSRWRGATLAAMRAGLVVVAIAACGDREVPRPPIETPAVPAPVAVAAPPIRSADAAAREVVAAWLDAQNRRDFDAYQALYAPGFTGIRRVGTATKTMDRAGWIADREAMFDAAMTVVANDVAVTEDAARLVVRFEQRWDQGAFADVGDKRLELDPAATRAGTSAAIVSEEMVTSRVVLNQLGCLRRLHPDAPAAATRVDPAPDSDAVTAIEVIDLGATRFVCRVDTRSADAPTTTSTAIAVVERGRGWTVVDAIAREVEDEHDATEDTARTGKVAISALALTAADVAVQVQVKATDRTPHSETGSETTTVYRITRAGFAEQLEYTTTWAADVEDTTGTTCALAVDTTRRRGYPDLTVSCSQRHPGDWWNEDVAKRGQEVTETATRYRWNGTSYEED